MTKEQLLAQTKFLLYSDYIEPEFRLSVENKLDNLNVEDLEKWHKVISEKIRAMSALENFLHQVEKNVAQIEDPKKSYKKRLSEHPLFSFKLPKVQQKLKENTLSYLKDGVDIKSEYDLYLQSQVQLSLDEELPDFEIYEIDEVRQAFLEGLLSCEQLIESKKGSMSVHDLLVLYDRTFNPASNKRSAFERSQIIEEIGVEEKNRKLVRNLLDTYDYLLYTDSLIVDEEGQEILDKLQNNPSQLIAEDKPQVEEVEENRNVKEKNFSEVVEQVKPIKNKEEKVVVTKLPSISKSSKSRLQLPDIDDQARIWNQSIKGNHLILNKLYQAALQRNIVASLAGLKVISQNGRLSGLVLDKRFTQLLLAKYRKEGNKEAEVSLLNNPNESYQLRNLLRMILEDRLKLNENDGAFVASDLIGMARDKGEKVEHVSYYDESDEKYHWI